MFVVGLPNPTNIIAFGLGVHCHKNRMTWLPGKIDERSSGKHFTQKQNASQSSIYERSMSDDRAATLQDNTDHYPTSHVG